jgi:hypothetical protein
MAAQTIENVISIADARALPSSRPRLRIVKPESAGVLNDCRDMALKRIVELLAGTFDKIEDELFELAQKTADRDTQNMYLEARAQSREKRGAIEGSFRKQFLSFFAKKVSGEDDPGKTTDVDYGSMELTLVGDDELEQKIAVDALANKMSDKCDDELRALSQRMAFLLSEPDLADSANPIAPDTIIKALKIACDQISGGYQAKLTVMRLAEQHISQDMLSIYHDINSHLVERKILPQIRVTYRKSPGGAPRTTPDAAAPAPEVKAAPAAADSAAGGNANPATDNILTTLQQLLAGANLFDPALNAGGPAPKAVPGDAGPAPGAANSRPATGEPSPGLSGLVAALTNMQQKALSAAAGMSAPPSAGNFLPGDAPAASLSMLREIKTPSMVENSAPIDVMTLDIVAMLFDYVFDDETIPEAIKGLIARLQIPALKVALLDRSFFSRKTHPARRLLDALADASVCFAGVASRDDPLYRMIETVVNRVHAEFETDIQIFADVLADFEKFLAERETANAKFVEQSARVVNERELREMARLVAQDEMEKRAADVEQLAPVTAFLIGPWARVLERIYLREGGRHERFAKALETAHDLTWSVTPKSNADERRQLLGMLPRLLKNLHQGMEMAAVEAEDRKRFFATLVDCHAAAVKAGLKGESVAALLTAAQPNAETEPLFAKLIAEEKARDAEWKDASRSGIARIQFTNRGVEIEELGTHNDSAEGGPSAHETPHPDLPEAPSASGGRRGAGSAVDFDITDMPVVELQRGTWVEFVQGKGRSIRAKLSWISPLKGVYLFTNPGVMAALSVTPDELQIQLRRGDARVIEESSLIDRAVGKIVDSLSQTAHI